MASAGGAKVAQKVKVGSLRRLGNYFGTILNDYKMVAQETMQDISEGSVKAAVYISSLIAAGILVKSNPSERDLEQTLLENSHDISLVGAVIRNQKSEDFINYLRNVQRQERLHYTSLGLFSLIWISDHRDELDLYEAKCKHVRLPWYQFHKKIVDVGILGKFIKINQMMEDFDVNEEEWKTQTNSK